MIEETATVVAINGKQVTVTSTIKSTCHSCHQQDDCGSGQIAKAIPHKALTTTITAGQNNLHIGDEVVIGLSEKSLLNSAVQVYLLPLLMMIVFATIGQFYLVEQLQLHELIALVFAVVGGYLGFVIAQKQQNSRHSQASLQPKLLRKCADIIATVELK
ncbi:SoxR reducing system RseC family protein [Thalassotalea sp. ND16A]|uniref:SoxR reducing system RseC family protein n=1 Tax=Thalassotalea sp. ND16A TaxID=1535422 RepID=UPI00051A3B28|nr:SoxR reducing system RseC family protein [Thalassotalea sp. ND16A]KGJ97701.1 hypothetical protein ND16A_0980 [Thalassotalea sp. ND16A]